ncbi:MAG: hypothetical protein H0T89_18720 [Deltaproteobacteria bacterium]|nr:hypothetical protein [Deltaproteobacteria bacterium]MDQ3301630.1 hypothetical protein [Myxococcota bacterium]
MRHLLVTAMSSFLLAACTEPRSAACRDVCKREALCVEETGSTMPFDEKECVAACAALEQDATVNAAKVKRHVDCVHKQQSCAAVLECK